MSGVMQSGLRSRQGAENTAAGMFAVSSLGDLAVIRGPLTGSAEGKMIWSTRDGRSSPAEPANGAPTGGRLHKRISPDGSRALVAVPTSLRRELWLVDWKRDAWTACNECGSAFAGGAWSPDGGRVLLGRNDTLVVHALDGSAPDQVVVQEAGRQLWADGWGADGRIVYTSSPDQTSFEIKLLEPGGHSGRVVVPLGIGTTPEMSPDGRWLAYASAQTGTQEVMVQAFPGPGAHVQISAGGGLNPAWSADGRTLYYLRELDQGGSAIVAVDISASSGLGAGKPRELFRRPESQRCIFARCFDISADGQRFLMIDRTAVRRLSVTRMDLILNWTATLGKGR